VKYGEGRERVKRCACWCFRNFVPGGLDGWSFEIGIQLFDVMMSAVKELPGEGAGTRAVFLEWQE